MKTLKQLLEERASKKTEADKLIADAKTANRDLTTEEEARVDKLLDEIEALGPQIEERQKGEAEERQRAERRSQRLSAAASLLSAAGNPGRGPEASANDWEKDPVINPDSRRYSLLRAINCLGNKRAVDGYEGEISQEMAHRLDKAAGGFFLPLSLGMRADRQQRFDPERREFDTTAGAGLIPTILATGRLIDALHAMPICARLGCQIITDAVGIFDIPRMDSYPTYSWSGESSVGTEAVPTTDVVSFTAKTLNIWYRVTRRMRHQTSIDVENKLRMMATLQMALAMDATAFNGSGATNNPTGLLNNSNISTVALGTNGGAPTWQAIVDMESSILSQNVLEENLAYVTTAYGRGTFKQTLKVGSTFPVFLADDNNQMNGRPLKVSNLMPSNLTKGTGSNLSSVLYGNWASLMIVLWGGLDVIVDPYTQTGGDLKVTMLQDADINVDHPQAFVKIVDMITV